MIAPRPKYPHVSYYPVKGKRRDGTVVERWRVTYRIPGRRTRTDRLGVDERKAQKRARQISDLIDSVRSKLMSSDEAERQLEDAKHINQHVEAYEAHLKAKGVKDSYIKTTIQRVKGAIAIIGATRLGHLTPKAIEKLLLELRKMRRPRGDGKPGGPEKSLLTAQTVQHYLTALKQFTRRMKRSGRVAADLLADVEGIKVVESESKRREPSADEMRALLIAATDAEIRKWNEMRGVDRAMLYAYAFATGLRLGELRVANVDWVKFGDGPAVITVPGKYTKNGKSANQPLPDWLAVATRTWIGKRTGVLFPRLPQSLHRMFQKDRETARQAWIKQKGISVEEKTVREKSDFLKYRTDQGVLVFHSLRHGYVSELANSDAPAKLVQALARHADISTTMNVYAKARSGAAASAVERAMPNVLPRDKGDVNGKEVNNDHSNNAKKSLSKKRKRKAQRSSDDVSTNKDEIDGLGRRETEDKND